MKLVQNVVFSLKYYTSQIDNFEIFCRLCVLCNKKEGFSLKLNTSFNILPTFSTKSECNTLNLKLYCIVVHAGVCCTLIAKNNQHFWATSQPITKTLKSKKLKQWAWIHFVIRIGPVMMMMMMMTIIIYLFSIPEIHQSGYRTCQ